MIITKCLDTLSTISPNDVVDEAIIVTAAYVMSGAHPYLRSLTFETLSSMLPHIPHPEHFSVEVLVGALSSDVSQTHLRKLTTTSFGLATDARTFFLAFLAAYASIMTVGISLLPVTIVVGCLTLYSQLKGVSRSVCFTLILYLTMLGYELAGN